MYNMAEAKYIVDLFCTLIRDYPKEKNNIGIIAPYRAQRKLITRMLKEYLGGKVFNSLDTEISTVDGFQGREKDIIIFSCVRAPTSNSSKQPVDKCGAGIGFLKEWQRLNVAITRARFGLWLVGHKATLQRDGEWDALIRFIEVKKAIVHLTNDKAFKECLRRRETVMDGDGGRNINQRQDFRAAGVGNHHSQRVDSSKLKRKFKWERRQQRREAQQQTEAEGGDSTATGAPADVKG